MDGLQTCVCLLFFISCIECTDKFVCQKQDDVVAGDQDVTDLELRIAALEARNTNDGDIIKALEDRIAELEEQLQFVNVTSPGIVQMRYSSPPRDCSQLYKEGERNNGVYTISPDGLCPFDVFCDMSSGGLTLIQRRMKGNVEFSQPWKKYVTGFGDLYNDFWLGLDKIHRLTKGGTEIVFQLGHYGKKKEDSWAYYDGFVVHDVTSGYAMNVDTFGFKGNMPDLFTYHDGVKFSTFDRDQDQFSSSCSEKMGGSGGWWYNSCYRLGNLNGIYGHKGKGGMSIWDKKERYIKTSKIGINSMLDNC